MANHNQIIADTRKTVSEKLSESVRSAGPPELRNATLIPDSVIETEIHRAQETIQSEFPERTIDFDQNAEAEEAMRYFTFIRMAFLNRDESGPLSISHARRYSYDDEQLEYWRDRMVRAVNDT